MSVTYSHKLCKRQKKTVRRHKYMEIKPHIPEQSMGQKNKGNFDTNENGNTTHQSICNAKETVLREKFIIKNAYIKKRRSQIHNITLHKEIKKKKKNKLSLKLVEGRNNKVRQK